MSLYALMQSSLPSDSNTQDDSVGSLSKKEGGSEDYCTNNYKITSPCMTSFSKMMVNCFYIVQAQSFKSVPSVWNRCSRRKDSPCMSRSRWLDQMGRLL